MRGGKSGPLQDAPVYSIYWAVPVVIGLGALSVIDLLCRVGLLLLRGEPRSCDWLRVTAFTGMRATARCLGMIF